MAKKIKKVAKRRKTTSTKKKGEKAPKSTVNTPFSKKKVMSTACSPSKPLTLRRINIKTRSDNDVSSSSSLRSSARLRKLKLRSQRRSKRVNARSRASSKRVIEQKKSRNTISHCSPSERIHSRKKLKSPTRKNIQQSSEDETEEYEVEKICDIKFHDGQEMYLVKWKGYGTKRNTWEPRENLGNAYEAISKFLQGQTYEVEYICGTRRIGEGREYRVRWKGWPASCDTWESRASLVKGAKQELQRFEKIKKKRMA